MKAGLIGAVAIGGAIAATLTWSYLAPVAPDPPAGGLADAPAASTDILGVPPSAEAPVRDAHARAPELDSPASAPGLGIGTAVPAAGSAGPTSAEAPRLDGPAAAPGLAPGDAPAAAPESSGPAAPDRLAAVAPGPGAAAAPDPARPREAGIDPRAPSFDIVRVDADGQAVIAGRTAPNGRVEVLLDGKVIETILTDPSGRFVAVLSTGTSADARELRLRVTLPDAPPPAEPVPPAGEMDGGKTGAPASDAARGPNRATAPAAALSGPAPPSTGSAPQLPAADRQNGRAAAPPRSASPAAAAGRAADAEGAGPVAPGPPPGGKAPLGAGSATAPTPAPLPAGLPAISSVPGEQAGSPAPTAPADAGPRAAPGDPAADRYLLSDAVIILPPEVAGAAPALVRVHDEQLALVQPGGAAPTGVVLDQLTQQPGGDLLLRGRARPGHAVRIYGNGRAIDTVAVADGGWSLTVPDAEAGDIRLFRLDEIARSGDVASRIEVPFQPSEAALHVVRDRKFTVRRGDNLWRIAEQHYGEGIRYSLIFGANGDLIRDADLIYPDQVFTVPELVEAE